MFAVTAKKLACLLFNVLASIANYFLRVDLANFLSVSEMWYVLQHLICQMTWLARRSWPPPRRRRSSSST